MNRSNYLLLPFLAILPSQSYATGQCADLYSENGNEESVNSHQSLTLTLVSILGYAFQNQIIADQQIEKWSRSSFKDFKIDVIALSSDAKTIAVKTALGDLVIEESVHQAWQDVQIKLKQLLNENESASNQRSTSKESTRFRLEPHLISLPIKTDGSLVQNSDWHELNDGDQGLIAFTSKAACLYRRSNIAHPKKFSTAPHGFSEPRWFTTRDNKAVFALGSGSNQLYVYDVEDLGHPKKFKTNSYAEGTPAWFRDQTGRELLAITSERYLHVFDYNLGKSILSRRLPVSAYGPIDWHDNGTGPEIVVGTTAGELLVIPLSKSKAIRRTYPTRIPKEAADVRMASVWYESPTHGPLILNTTYHEFQIFKPDLSEAIFKYNGEAHQLSATALYVDKEKRALLALVSAQDNESVRIFDLDDINRPPYKLPIAGISPASTLLSWHASADGRRFLAVPSYHAGVYIFDVTDLDHPVLFKIDIRETRSALAWLDEKDGQISATTSGFAKSLDVISLYRKSNRK